MTLPQFIPQRAAVAYLPACRCPYAGQHRLWHYSPSDPARANTPSHPTRFPPRRVPSDDAHAPSHFPARTFTTGPRHTFVAGSVTRAHRTAFPPPRASGTAHCRGWTFGACLRRSFIHHAAFEHTTRRTSLIWFLTRHARCTPAAGLVDDHCVLRAPEGPDANILFTATAVLPLPHARMLTYGTFTRVGYLGRFALQHPDILAAPYRLRLRLHALHCCLATTPVLLFRLVCGSPTRTDYPAPPPYSTTPTYIHAVLFRTRVHHHSSCWFSADRLLPHRPPPAPHPLPCPAHTPTHRPGRPTPPGTPHHTCHYPLRLGHLAFLMRMRHCLGLGLYVAVFPARAAYHCLPTHSVWR